MSSICDRLREMADLFEAQQAPHNFVLHLRAGADEIERLRSGGCARDQGLTQYCAEAERLAREVERLISGQHDVYAAAREEYRKKIKDQAAEIERLRAALGDLLAIIHRDGGHHTAAVGEQQSVEDAHKVWAKLISENESLSF